VTLRRRLERLESLPPKPPALSRSAKIARIQELLPLALNYAGDDPKILERIEGIKQILRDVERRCGAKGNRR
jgi:hypothetical protein